MLTKKPPAASPKQKNRPKQAVYCDYFHGICNIKPSAVRTRYCGAIIYFAPQEERVKDLSEARLDRSYSTSVTELITLNASIKPVSLTVFCACGDMFIK